MADSKTPMQEDPQYLRAQAMALQALLLAVAGITTTKEAFRAQGMQRLEALRTALLPTPVSDAQLAAVDDMQRWLWKSTE